MSDRTYPRPVMVKIEGKTFRCDCGCNVLTAYAHHRYTCNGCGARYVGDGAEPVPPTLEERCVKALDGLNPEAARELVDAAEDFHKNAANYGTERYAKSLARVYAALEKVRQI